MKTEQKIWLGAVAVLAVLVVGVLVWAGVGGARPFHMEYSDGIEQIDLDTIYLKTSGVEVNFADVILSRQNETRKLIVSTQTATVSAKLTDRLIQQLDFDFLKKTQNVTYTGTGYFVVDLDGLTAENVVTDREKRTVTILIDHAYLQAIEIDPDKVIIEETKKGLLAWGEIELTMKDYKAIEQELRTRLEQKFDTVENGQTADDLALEMVESVYEPIVQAIDRRYSVTVRFK